MTERLTDVLVCPPSPAFGAAYDDPAHGFRHRVDLDLAMREHTAFRELLSELGVAVHLLDTGAHPSPDAIYAYDPSLVTDRGAVLLRSGKASRVTETDLHAGWYRDHGIGVVGQIQAPGTVDGGDVLWLRPGLMAVGRSLRTNQAGISQLSELVAEEVLVFDVPFDRGPSECLHLMSVLSPVADDLAVIETARLPSGLWSLLGDLGIRTLEVPESEIDTLGANILAIAPGIVVMLDANPGMRARLTGEGVEVHTFSGSEICLNGSGGPTCLTRPLRRTR